MFMIQNIRLKRKNGFIARVQFFSTCGKDAIWNEESSHSYANQHQELEEPETEKKKKKKKKNVKLF